MQAKILSWISDSLFILNPCKVKKACNCLQAFYFSLIRYLDIVVYQDNNS